MDGAEFIRKIKRLGEQRGVAVRVDEKRGKGSHSLLYYGGSRTIVPQHAKRDLKPGTLRAILRQLGLTPRDLEE